MKTVGERIRQAREYRKLSGYELAIKVGYKTQSGIGNLENRATGHGGYMLPKIAKELNFELQWFLQGPDTQDMATVRPFSNSLESTDKPIEDKKDWTNQRIKAHGLLDEVGESGLVTVISMLEAIRITHPIQKEDGSDYSVSISQIKAA